MRRRTFLGAIQAAVAAFFVPKSTVAVVDEGARMGFVESVRLIESQPIRLKRSVTWLGLIDPKVRYSEHLARDLARKSYFAKRLL